MGKPLVSVCVPAYNSIAYLDRFLASFFAQTLTDIELVIVDNLSDDGTYEHLQKIAAADPERVFLHRLKEHAPGPAVGRNEAIRHARADYLYCCDCDDVIYPLALERLYAAASEQKADVVVANANLIMCGDDYGPRRVYGQQVKAGKLHGDNVFSAGVELWRRLIHKDLLAQFGPIYEDVKIDDIAFVPVLMSYAQNVWAIDDFVYCYFRRENSTVGGQQRNTCLDTIASEKRALEKANPQNCEWVEKYVAARIKLNLNYRWQGEDLFIQQLHELWPRFQSNPQITGDAALMDALKPYLERTAEKAPAIVYLNGFDRQYTPEELLEYGESAISGGSRVCVLDRDTCDITARPWIAPLLEQGKTRFVAHYFALKRICEDGGVFIDSCLRLNASMNMLQLHENGFVALMSDNKFSDLAFGGRANTPFFRKVLEIYESSAFRPEQGDIGWRFRTVLWAEYGAPDHYPYFEYKDLPITVLRPSFFTVNIAGYKNMAEIDFTRLDPAQDDIDQIKQDIVNAVKTQTVYTLKRRDHAKPWQELSNVERLWRKMKGTLPGRALRKAYHVAKRIKHFVKR